MKHYVTLHGYRISLQECDVNIQMATTLIFKNFKGQLIQIF